MSTARLARSAPASVVGIPASRTPAGQRDGKSNSMTSTGIALPIDILGPANLKTSATGGHIDCPKFSLSLSAVPVKTSRSWRTLSKINRNVVLVAASPAFSSTAWRSSERFSPSSSCSKTFQTCSIPMVAETFKRLSAHSPNSVTWDLRACSIHRLSECPKTVVGFSWLHVLDKNPHSSSWLTLGQWKRYLLRLARAESQRARVLGLGILLRLQTSSTTAIPESILAVNFSLLRKADGIRWLSGPERLRYMGFPGDWMRPTLKRLMRPETPCPPPMARWVAEILNRAL